MTSLVCRTLRTPSLVARPLLLSSVFRASLSTVGVRPIILPSKKIVAAARSHFIERRFMATEKDDEVGEEAIGDDEEDEGNADVAGANDWMNRRSLDPKDRSRVIPLEVSLAYMESAAYKASYGDKKIWELYRRNFTRGLTFRDTRKTCIRHGKISSGNPCPICRDEYLVVDYRNLKLLNQFLSDYNGELLSSRRTGVCQIQYNKLLLEIERAKDRGLLRVDPPFVEYDYKYYMPKDC